jgi:hypothetical protein
MDDLPMLRVEQLPDGTYAYTKQPAVPQSGPQVVHIHQAPPDRTMQRVALGGGMGAGAVAAGVYFGPLLVGVLTAIAVNLAIVAVVVVGAGWAVVSIVRSIGGPEGKNAAKNISKARRKR